MKGTVCFNGVNGVTGQYLAPQESAGEITGRLAAEPNARLSDRAQRTDTRVLGLPFDVSPLEAERAGWAVVIRRGDQATLSALQPLLKHRATTLGERVKVLQYEGESREVWLAKHRVADSDIDPERVPYYLLVAGQSADIPFSFVHDLAVDYAVGRVEFDALDDYTQYAHRIVEYETSATLRQCARRVAFFGPRHEFDGATQLSADYLLSPLADPADERSAVKRSGFTPTSDIGSGGTKRRLAELLREADGKRPALLFTASHGVGFPMGHELQKTCQGALLCQEWPSVGEINEAHYFAGSDVPADAHVAGLVVFHFACYSAGTPERDRFYKQAGLPPARLTMQPFVAALPKELLRRGALAVVGHVDRAWGYSFVSPDSQREHLQSFENFLGRVLSGEPVGHAMRDFAQKYATLSVSLTKWIEKSDFELVSEDLLVQLWTQRNDAGSYLVIGDPLARIQPEAVAAERHSDE
ncbi:MAG TPA: hypothetical protein VEK57_12710 [Thermoanaerobaculia bacterium]|nr:hypothetical protein [Thermoanaerobaculia bacterium]